MKLAFFGTGEFACPALRSLRAAGHDLRRVVSQPDRPAGRGLALRPTAVRSAALELGLAHFQVQDVNALAPRELIDDAELAVIVAFGQKIGPALLSAAPNGFVNIHGSLLPKFRGAAPIQWSILSGERDAGVTTFMLNERWDAGPILGRRATPIGETETADELHDRLAQLGAELIVETVAAIERGDATPLVQDVTLASRAPKLSKTDGFIDWAAAANVIVRRIHGLWSWPAATCLFIPATGKPIPVQLVRAVALADDAPPAAPPGSIRADGTIQTGRGRVRVLEIKPAGGKLMSFEQFANGRDVRPPARFERVAAP